MSATSKAIAARLTFTVEVKLSVLATEAKWKKLTKDYRDPNESWASEAQSVIGCFIEEELAPKLSGELTDSVKVVLSDDTICGLDATEPAIFCCDLEDVELEEVGS
ncbi:hypothetical protein SynWH8101_0780 [Synechococcus sp. WH 8101]|uniref:hypothetical protein n=1 Tax=Synechococcus sp. WH 8101 TaxID=59932 RepID=UPI001022F620|nr:hypothetical protein [Synechococcus sp. WH 8101]QBE68370.1 hypothetical protein SynWH8101_0780 [Synechococcus sp. WH 8101]